jgi:hypothetical protein
MNRMEVTNRAVLAVGGSSGQRTVARFDFRSEIVVRDLKSGAETVIGWKNGKAFSGELTAPVQQASRPN